MPGYATVTRPMKEPRVGECEAFRVIGTHGEPLSTTPPAPAEPTRELCVASISFAVITRNMSETFYRSAWIQPGWPYATRSRYDQRERETERERERESLKTYYPIAILVLPADPKTLRHAAPASDLE